MPTLLSGFDSQGGVTGNVLIELDRPSGVALNDLLLIAVVCGTDAIPTLPEGFAPVPGAGVTGVSTCIRIYQKIATASEPTSYFVYGPSGVIYSACIAGIHPTTLTYAYVQAVATNSSAVASTDKVWNSVTTINADQLLLCFGAFATTGGSTAHAGMTERVDVSSSTARLYLMTEIVALAGATGTRTATGTSASLIRTVTLAITETNEDPTPLAKFGIWDEAGSLTVFGPQLSISTTFDGIATSETKPIEHKYVLIAPPPNTRSMKVRASWQIVGTKTGGILNSSMSLGADGPPGLTQAGGISTEDYQNNATTSGSEVMSWGLPAWATEDWPCNRDTIVSSPPADPEDCVHIDMTHLMSAASGHTITIDIDMTVEVIELEFDDGTIWSPLGVAVTVLPVLAELAGEGAQVTQMGVLAELAAQGIYTTELPVYAEFAAIGIYLTALPVLIEIQYVEPILAMPTYYPASAGTRRMHTLLPDEVTGYAFDPEYSWWSSVVAEESTNLIFNPSFEGWNVTDTVDEFDFDTLDALEYVEFPAVGATAGRRCAKLTMGAFTGALIYEAAVQVTPGPYTFSCDVYVTRIPFQVDLLVTGVGGSGPFAKRAFRVTSTGWQRLSVTYVELGSGLREMRLSLPFSNPQGTVVYTDAWQFEAKPYATTYLDGDMVGWNDTAPFQSYYWQGEPHHSRSTRRERTGSGGRIVNWSEEVGFKTTSIVGLGMTTVEQRTQTLGDGREVHLASIERGRDFTITGRIFGNNHRNLLNRHNDLIRLLKPNNTRGGDQMVLRFQEVDDHEQLVGAPLEIVCVYREGMQGNITNLYQENLPLQFRAVQPFPMDAIESSAEIEPYKLLVDNGLIYRDEYGEFFNFLAGTTLGGVADRVAFLRDGSPAAFGNFTDLQGSGVATAAYWDGTDWVALGAPTVPGPATWVEDGFRMGFPLTIAHGGALWEYDEINDEWNAISLPLDANIFSYQRDANGDIWAGGLFVQDDAATTTFNYVAKWVAATGLWEVLGQGLSDPDIFIAGQDLVNTIIAPGDGSVYIGGNFGRGTNLVGDVVTLASGAIRWDIETQEYDAMGSGFDDAPTQFIRAQDGYIYAVGPFGQNGTETYDLRGFARYNGYEWEEVFPLVKADGTFGADGFVQDEDGIFWFYNYATDENDFFVLDALGHVPSFGYRHGAFYPPPLYLNSITYIAFGPGNRTIYAQRSFTGADVYAASLNRIDYGGSADAPFALHVQGPGQFFQAVNLSTEGGVYGRGGFTLNLHEEMLIRTDTQRALLYSNQRFNLQTNLSAGASSMKALRLRPGINRVSVLMADIDADTKLWLTWKNRFWGLEDVRE